MLKIIKERRKMIGEKRSKRLSEESNWIKKSKFVIDYTELADKFSISRESSRHDIVYMLHNKMIKEKDVLCSKDGKNGFGETIYRLYRKYPKSPGYQVEGRQV
jgi:hypothetical protein